MAPLAAIWFGAIPIAGFLANLIAVPWVGAVSVPLGLLGALGELCVPGGGRWLFAVSGFSLELLARLLAFLADLRFALWPVGNPDAVALGLAMLGSLILLAPRGLPGRPLGLPLFLPLLFPPAEHLAPGTLAVRMFDVGQGTAVLVSTPDIVLLYDTGPRSGAFDAGERIVVPALRALRIRRLDWIVVSHGDADHAGGLEAARRAYPEARLFASGIPGAEPCLAGQRFLQGSTALLWLHPPAWMPDLRNESSCVLRIEHKNASVLLPGDIGLIVEGRLLRERPGDLRAEVVLVPHHGSRRSSSPDFVKTVKARHALISAAHGNPFGHPAPEVVKRWRQSGATVHATACGMIELVYREGSGWERRAARASNPRIWRRPCPSAFAPG